MLSNPMAFKNDPSQIIRLWTHETRRVFEDRMINEEDQKTFREF